MAYQTYITEALVCGSRNNNTSDRSYLLFTREGGMVWASARSVREERSKQRFALQEFSHIRATMVRGKGGWRLAGVESLGNMYYDSTTREHRALLKNIIVLLTRVIQGETPHYEVFDDVIISLQKSNEYNAQILELLLTLRILGELGYVAPDEVSNTILDLEYAYQGIADFDEKQKHLYAEIVENALTHSQL